MRVPPPGRHSGGTTADSLAVEAPSGRARPIEIPAPRRFRSSRSRDLSGDTLISDVSPGVCWLLPLRVVLRLTGPLDRFSSSGSCLIGISDTDGMMGLTSDSCRLIAVAALLLLSMDAGDTGQSAPFASSGELMLPVPFIRCRPSTLADKQFTTGVWSRTWLLGE